MFTPKYIFLPFKKQYTTIIIIILKHILDMHFQDSEILTIGNCERNSITGVQCTEMPFASFFSGGFISAIVVNPPERKLVKRTSVHCTKETEYGSLRHHR